MRVTRNYAHKQILLDQQTFENNQFTKNHKLRKIKETRLQSMIPVYTFNLDLVVMVTQNIAQYLLHYVTYAPAKIEAATSIGLGGDAITRKIHHSTLTLTFRS